jgi:hypothetical protein
VAAGERGLDRALARAEPVEGAVELDLVDCPRARATGLLNVCSLFTAGRLYLNDELGICFVSSPGRSGNQIQVVIDPKRVKPHVSFDALFL